jgi:SRSO17 transposase
VKEEALMRIPHAPLEPLPDLAEFLKPFRSGFARSEGVAALERYITGLLSEQSIKNCDTMAQVVPNTTEQSLEGLLTDMVWDEQSLNCQRIRCLLSLPSEGDAVLVFDDTGFAKQGSHSVGVQRQYSGTLGKRGNCQVSVNCHYAERTLAWPIATHLYLPRAWTEDPIRLAKAKVPKDITFQTKPAIALGLLDLAREVAVPHSCVTADADYGDNPNFLDGLELWNEHYVAAVRCDFQVNLQPSAAHAQGVDAVIASQGKETWRSVYWREGSKGWLRARFCAVRCWRVRSEDKPRIGWLIGEDASDGKRRYYWSNFGKRVSLGVMVEYAHRRHWVEQYHEEAKGLLGWDQYQGRLWPGFHRHAVCVMLAYSFLVWQEFQQRLQQCLRGRPRRPSSPRPDRRRLPLAEIDRRISDELPGMAIKEMR